ncbi:MAG: pantoate--beta-alanine ligase [Chloroflexaceae bacterium]|nr:pantoate--beta-alanine ligase [Chloroflexaceae bacterium]
MQVIETIGDFRRARAAFGRLGLVPTMGYLHEGHLSLVRQARATCGAVAVSIFVNPTQFGPQEDFATYPRDTERDMRLLRSAPTDLVFVPTVSTMYPQGFASLVEVAGVTEVLEGAARPGHFRGVATVVCKLLNIVQPTHAFFGQKDAQQVVVIQTMVRDLNLPTEVVVGPTVREPDGLAMSSRNTYLSPPERQAATVLYRALVAAQQRYAQGVREGEAMRQTMHQVLDREPLARTDYVSVADPRTLQELDAVGDQGALLSMAVFIGTTRLIDALLLSEP